MDGWRAGWAWPDIGKTHKEPQRTTTDFTIDALIQPSPTPGRRRGARSVARHHRGAANECMCHLGATSRQSATVALPRPPCSDVALAPGQGPTMVPPRYPCAVVARPSGQTATVAPPKQSCANMVPNWWQRTIVVQ